MENKHKVIVKETEVINLLWRVRNGNENLLLDILLSEISAEKFSFYVIFLR